VTLILVKYWKYMRFGQKTVKTQERFISMMDDSFQVPLAARACHKLPDFG
jgi:hypothetical protein